MRLWRSVLAAAVCSTLVSAQAPAPSAQNGPATIDRAAIVWPPGYIEPNTPGMPYLAPDTPTGTGSFKAIMISDPGAPEFVTYHPANLTALGGHYRTAEFDLHFDYGLNALLDGIVRRVRAPS